MISFDIVQEIDRIADGKSEKGGIQVIDWSCASKWHKEVAQKDFKTIVGMFKQNGFRKNSTKRESIKTIVSFTNKTTRVIVSFVDGSDGVDVEWEAR